MFVNAVTADDTLRGNTCERETAAATDEVKTINLSPPLLSLDNDWDWDCDKEFLKTKLNQSNQEIIQEMAL